MKRNVSAVEFDVECTFCGAVMNKSVVTDSASVDCDGCMGNGTVQLSDGDIESLSGPIQIA